jgi:hypothetical protein
LARYPRFQFIVFDIENGGEFKREFKKMCDNYDIKDKPTTIQIIPTTNAIVERVDKVVNNILRSFDLEKITKILKNKKINHLITSYNQLDGYQTIRSIYHTTLKATPCHQYLA